MNNEIKNCFSGVKDGETFTVGDMEFIKFPSVNGMTPVVMKDIAFRSAFGDNNDFKESLVLRRMEKEILPKVIEAVGVENLRPIKTDLTALDGLKDYGEAESLISLVTLDFYRANTAVFDEHNVDCWWWLATPWSTPSHNDGWCVLCVSPSGCLGNGHCYFNGLGVRPFCILESHIFVSD